MADLPHIAQGDPHVPAHNLERDAINTLQNALPGKIAKPNNPALGTTLRFDGDNWVPSKTRLFEGDGSPEGVVSAPPGSRYVDTTAANGNAEYFKQAGTGNTGWTPLFTGVAWTNFTLATGWSHGATPAQVSMVNGVVYYRGAVKRTSGSGVSVGSVPSGLGAVGGLLTMIRVVGDMIPWAIGPTGAISIGNGVPNNTDIYVGAAAGVPYRIS